MHLILVCIVGLVLNALPAPFDSSGIAVFGCGAAVYTALTFPPRIAIPIAMVISLPFWLADGSSIGKESLTLFPIIISALCYRKPMRNVIKVGVGVWAVAFLPILMFEHALRDINTFGDDEGVQLGMMFSGVLVTWMSGLFGLVSGHFSFIAIHGLNEKIGSDSSRVSLRTLFSYFFSGSFFFASMIVIYMSVSLYQSEQESQIKYYMDQRVDVLEQQLAEFVTTHQRAVSYTAQLLSESGSASQFQAIADNHLAALAFHYPEYLTFLITDQVGNITHAYPSNLIEKARASGLTNVAMRPYFYEVMQTRTSYISNVFQGKGFGNDPIVAMSSPLFDENNDIRGIVEGSLSLKSFSSIDDLNLAGFALLLEDEKGEVIYASEPLKLNPLQKAPEFDCDPFCEFDTQTQLGEKSWLRIVGKVPNTGWKVSYYFNYRSLLVVMSNYLLKDLLILIVLSAVGTLAGFLVARLFNAPIDTLIRYIAGFQPHREHIHPRKPIVPLNIKELNLLSKEFTAHETRLLQAFDELEQARIKEQALNVELANLNTSLEARIKEKTEHLASALEKANAASTAKTQFLANMSHEIRTPMNGILGSCDLMLETKLDNDTRHRVEVMSRSAQNLLSILDSILDWSKLDAGKMLVDKRPVNVKQLLEASLHLYQYIADQKGVKLSLYCDGGLPKHVNMDGGKVSQIINNLVSNALKFTLKGDVTVKVRHRKGEVVFTVADTGIGIARDKLATIFEQFEQADASTTRHFGGTGLGLSITQGLIELLEGKITLSSREGEGSRFVVSIPAHSVDIDEHQPHEGKTTIPPTLSVLLAEDNDINAEIVTAMLKGAGIRCDRASNGEEAVQRATEKVYDIILMDCQMPIMDGLLATRKIRANCSLNKDTVVIALTANAFSEDRQACLEAGMNEHLSKPVRKNSLFECISRFV